MHQCFRRGCTVMVDNKFLACYPCWRLVSPAAQRAVYRTRGLHLLHRERRAALKAVQADWGY